MSGPTKGATMRLVGFTLVLTFTLAAIAPPASAEHVITREALNARLAEAAAQRAAEVLSIRRLLADPDAARVARLGGADVSTIAAGVTALSDPELADLASRANALTTDPVAGHVDHDVWLLVKVFLIVAIVVLVLQAVK